MSTTLTDLELIEKSQSYFLTKKRVRNDGYVPKYYVKNSHEGIITKEDFVAVQTELGRRSNLRGYSKTPASYIVAIVGLSLIGRFGVQGNIKKVSGFVPITE